MQLKTAILQEPGKARCIEPGHIVAQVKRIRAKRLDDYGPIDLPADPDTADWLRWPARPRRHRRRQPARAARHRSRQPCTHGRAAGWRRQVPADHRGADPMNTTTACVRRPPGSPPTPACGLPAKWSGAGASSSSPPASSS